MGLSLKKKMLSMTLIFFSKSQKNIVKIILFSIDNNKAYCKTLVLNIKFELLHLMPISNRF